MMRYFILLSLLVSSLQIFAQNDTLVLWNLKAKQSAAGKYVVYGSGKISDGWKLYAAGKAVSDSPGIIKPIDFLFAGNNFQPSTISFNSSFRQVKDAIFNTANVYSDSLSFQLQVNIKGTVPAKLTTTLSYYLGRGEEFIPAEYQAQIDLPGGIEASSDEKKIIINNVDLNAPMANCGGVTGSGKNSLLYVFFLGLIRRHYRLANALRFPDDTGDGFFFYKSFLLP